MATATLTLGSQNRWLADGATTIWNFNFVGGYLGKDTVKAYYMSNDVVPVRTDLTITESNFTGDYQLSITPPVPNQYELVIYRDSKNGGLPRSDFTDGGGITEQNLDALAAQAVFVTQEIEDFLGTATEASLSNSLAQITSGVGLATAAEAAAEASQLLAAESEADAAASASAALVSQNAAAASEANVAALRTPRVVLVTAVAAQTDIPLPADPGSIDNLQVIVDGVTYTKTADFTWPSTLVVRMTAPMTAGQEVQIRYLQAVAIAATALEAQLSSSAVGEGASKVVAESGDTLQAVAAASGRAFVPSGTDDLAALLNSVAAAGNVVALQVGTYALSGATFTGQRLHLRGSGENLSFIKHTGSGACITYNAGGGGGFNEGSIAGVGFIAAGTTASKVAVNFVNVANSSVTNVYITTGNWVGSDCVGIQTAGRQLVLIDRCKLACDRPILVKQNASFPSLSTDHFSIMNSELVVTNVARAGIEFETGVSFSNVTLEHLAIAKGKHGIYWNDTTSTAASFALSIRDIRTEQGDDPTGYSIYLASTAQFLQDVVIDNAHLDLNRNGLYLRNAQRVTIRNATYAGTGTSIDMTFVSGSRLILENFWQQVGSTMTLTNAKCIRREDVTGAGIVEEWVYDSGIATSTVTSAGAMSTDAYLGGVPFTLADSTTKNFANTSFTGYIVVGNSQDVTALIAVAGTTGTLTIVNDWAGQFSLVAGTANRTNIYKSGSNYVIENKRGVSLVYHVLQLGFAR